MNAHPNHAAPIGEPFVDAREAAYTLNLPMYYLTNAAKRKQMQIPHYHVGHLIRYKLSELTVWLQSRHDRQAREVSFEASCEETTDA